MPKKGAEEKDVAVATRLVPDARATHYWDGSGTTMRDFGAVLGIPGDAWDVYLVYGPQVRWDGDLPPKPEYWMHQLGGEAAGPRLDPRVFAEHATALLAAR